MRYCAAKSLRRRTLVGGVAALAAAAIALIFLSRSVGPDQSTVERPEPMPFTRELLAAMARAERIIISEHSFESDFGSNAAARNTGRVTYASVELNAQQKTNLRAMIASADELLQAAARVPEPSGGYAVTACIFDPHHTIFFIRNGKPDGELSICFECSKLAWNDDAGAPQALMGALPAYLEQIGLQPKRDWDAMASQAAAAAAMKRAPHSR